MKKIKIFLASSAELKSDRDALFNFISMRNRTLHDQGFFIDLFRWEDEINAVTDGRTQSKYNSWIVESDYLICLFQSKAGSYTVEEFEVGMKAFADSRKPEVYVLFKDSNIKISAIAKKNINSLFRFQDRLKKMEHFLQWYDNTDDLKLKVQELIDKIIRNSTII